VIIFCIEYVFSERDYVFEFRRGRNYRPLALANLERLKTHFKVAQDRTAEELVRRMEKMRVEKDGDFDEDEGFFSSDDEVK
jgi:hypothetical protein